jgi:radical SAM superfamily enzyme YgiQ (UPF0313 family)
MPTSYDKEICRLIIHSGLNIDWRCIFYPDLVDDALIKRMAEAGCREVSLGFESCCARILKNMNKRFYPEDVSGAGKTQHPTDGVPDAGRSRRNSGVGSREPRLCRFASPGYVKVSQGIRIYPHTTLAKIAVDEGRIAPDDHLLKPTLYIVREIENWLKETLKVRMAERPNWMA